MQLNLNPKYVPKISKERMDKLLKRIRPLVRKNGILHEVATLDSVTASLADNASAGKPVDQTTLVLRDSVMTYHLAETQVPHPTVLSVLAQLNQLPEAALEGIEAFEVRIGDRTGEYMERYGFTGHSLLTLLYGPAR